MSTPIVNTNKDVDGAEFKDFAIYYEDNDIKVADKAGYIGLKQLCSMIIELQRKVKDLEDRWIEDKITGRQEDGKN